MSKEELPEEISEWQEAMLEIEGLVSEEVSRLQKAKKQGKLKEYY